jgi:hypothetical protein
MTAGQFRLALAYILASTCAACGGISTELVDAGPELADVAVDASDAPDCIPVEIGARCIVGGIDAEPGLRCCPPKGERP